MDPGAPAANGFGLVAGGGEGTVIRARAIAARERGRRLSSASACAGEQRWHHEYPSSFEQARGFLFPANRGSSRGRTAREGQPPKPAHGGRKESTHMADKKGNS